MTKKSRLIKKFKKLTLQFHAHNKKNDLAQSTLYHFTNETAFPDIISSKNLLLTSFDKLNDSKEIKFSKDFIWEVFKKYRGYYCLDFLNKFEFFLEKVNTYVVCFCADSKNEHLWNKYGDEHKGLALGFLPKYKKNEEIDYLKDWPSVIMHVKYGKRVLQDDLYTFIETFARLLSITRSDAEYEFYVDGFVRNIYPSLPRYKSKEWKNEKEHRWCMMDRGLTKKILPEFIVGGKAVSKNVVIEQLCEVIIGRESTLTVSEVRNALRTNGYDLTKINIIKK